LRPVGCLGRLHGEDVIPVVLGGHHILHDLQEATLTPRECPHPPSQDPAGLRKTS
jgi:hypothetical protein